MRVFVVVLLVVAAVATAEEPPAAVQTGPGRRVIAADDSTRTLAAIGADGRVEWKLPCRQIHDLHLMPDGHLLNQDGWTRIVELDADRMPVWQYDAKGNGHSVLEVTPDKEVVWTFKDFKTFGNSLPVAVVLDP